MSKLRPECRSATAKDGAALPYDTALFLIRESVARRKELIYGRLDGTNGEHCAIGAFWADNPNSVLNSFLIDEVAAVNDSVPPTASAKERWKKVNSWLRFKIAALTKSSTRQKQTV
jgi:hypothetical protein